MALPKTYRGFDAIFTVVDRLSKMIHVFPTHTSVSAPALARLILDRVVVLHGFPATIVSDRDPRFTSHFWRALFSASGTTLAMSTAFHPQLMAKLNAPTASWNRSCGTMSAFTWTTWTACLLPPNLHTTTRYKPPPSTPPSF